MFIYLTVLFAAFGEALAFVGLLVPGVGIVFGAGLLAARGAADPWWIGALASVGSAAGFALSYHLGRAGGPRIARWGQRFEGALALAAAFFGRYGTWSVFWGHFFGPVRALVAFAAGASGLTPGRFWLASLTGAVVWGYGLTLSGVVASGGWAAVEARLGRASLLLAAMAILLYLALRLASGMLLLGLRLLPSAAGGLLRWLPWLESRPRLGALLRTHPKLGHWLAHRLEPDRATGLLLSVGALGCAGFAWLFFGVVEDLFFHDPLVQVDRNVFHLLQALRTPEADRLFLAVTYLGSLPVLAAALAGALVSLLWLRRRFEALLLTAGFAAGEFLMWAIKQGVGRARPAPAAPLAVESTGAFPSNHAFSALALWGFLAYLWGRTLTTEVSRARVYALGGLVVAAVGMSRLYLGVHWLSDVIGGYALGGIWLTSLITAAEVRARSVGAAAPEARWRLRLAAGATMVIATISWVGTTSANLRRDLGRPSQVSGSRAVSPEDPLTAVVQLTREPVEGLFGYARGSPGAVLAGPFPEIVAALEHQGWVRAESLEISTLVSGLTAALKGDYPEHSPVVPLFWKGRPQTLALARLAEGGRQVLLLWQAGLELPGPTPLWTVWEGFEPTPGHFLGAPLPWILSGPPRPGGTALARELAQSGRFRPLVGSMGTIPTVLTPTPQH